MVTYRFAIRNKPSHKRADEVAGNFQFGIRKVHPLFDKSSLLKVAAEKM
jgi:hypothetical protein